MRIFIKKCTLPLIALGLMSGAGAIPVCEFMDALGYSWDETKSIGSLMMFSMWVSVSLGVACLIAGDL